MRLQRPGQLVPAADDVVHVVRTVGGRVLEGRRHRLVVRIELRRQLAGVVGEQQRRVEPEVGERSRGHRALPVVLVHQREPVAGAGDLPADLPGAVPHLRERDRGVDGVVLRGCVDRHRVVVRDANHGPVLAEPVGDLARDLVGSARTSRPRAARRSSGSKGNGPYARAPAAARTRSPSRRRTPTRTPPHNGTPPPPPPPAPPPPPPPPPPPRRRPPGGAAGSPQAPPPAAPGRTPAAPP